MDLIDTTGLDVEKKDTFAICKLFPSTVFISKYDNEFSEDVINFVINQNKYLITGNSGSRNMNVLDDPVMQDVKSFIQVNLEFYFNRLFDPSSKLEPYITQSWFAYTEPGEFHHRHTHKNSIISGVLYINADRNKDRISFHKTDNAWFEIQAKAPSNLNSTKYMFPVGTGDLLLFRSDMEHEVEAVTTQNSNHTRVSLAFNSFIRGELGIYEEASGLFLG